MARLETKALKEVESKDASKILKRSAKALDLAYKKHIKTYIAKYKK